MRRLMIFFGLLDAGIVITYANRLPHYVSGLQHQPALSLVCLLVTVALVASCYGLLRDRPWVFLLNYVLFPFRLVLAFLSLIWLALLILPPHPAVLLNESVYGVAVAFEGVRLGLTIMLQVERRRQRHNHPLQWTGPGRRGRFGHAASQLIGRPRPLNGFALFRHRFLNGRPT